MTRTPFYIAYRLEYIRQRRTANARARAMGFRNYDVWSSRFED